MASVGHWSRDGLLGWGGGVGGDDYMVVRTPQK